MAAYTWTKEKCDTCGDVTRTRGVHKNDSLTCFACRIGKMRWTEIHYGKEKYAGTNAGKTIKRESIATRTSDHCGHSACSQHFIDTGARDCVAAKAKP